MQVLNAGLKFLYKRKQFISLAYINSIIYLITSALWLTVIYYTKLADFDDDLYETMTFQFKSHFFLLHIIERLYQ